MRKAAGIGLGLMLVALLVAQTAGAQDLVFDNSDFEMGDYTNWTATGVAFGVEPTDTDWPTSNAQGTYHANSFHAGEDQVGTLVSDTFTIPEGDYLLRFMIAGHDGWPGDTAPKGVNFVRVRLAADDSVVGGPVAAPNSNDLVNTSIDVSDYAGQDAYIEIVDGDDAGGFAWIAADYFRWELQLFYDPAGINGNGNFELGTYEGWTSIGAAFGDAPYNQEFPSTNPEGNYHANSWVYGETQTGMLVSDPFEVTADAPLLTFMIGGWDGWPNETLPKGVCFVQVKLASDDSVIGGPVAPPNQNDMVDASIDLSGYVGDTVYVEIVDGDDAEAYAWLTADNFRMEGLPVDLGISSNIEADSIAEGQRLELTAGDGGTDYVWFKDGAPLAASDRISGVDARVLVIDPVSMDDIGSYTVRFTINAEEVESEAFVIEHLVRLPAAGLLGLLALVSSLGLYGYRRSRS